MSGAPRILVREQLLPARIEEVWSFFSDAGNLEAITPSWLRFRILTPRPIEMHEGTLIEYRLRLGLLPVGWRTRIATWEPPLRFADVQERGPFALWEHHHEFRSLGGMTHMLDRVRYRLPLGRIGGLLGGIPVDAALAAIFDHRHRSIAGRFGPPPRPEEAAKLLQSASAG